MKKPRGKSRHHRKARSLGGTNDKTNISIVKRKSHQAFHLLFGRGNPFHIASILNEVWVDPDYEIIARRKE